MNLKREKIQAALERKGFRRRNTDQSYFQLYDSGGKKTIVSTKTSFGSNHRTLGATLVSQMARQCKLTKAQFRALVECTLSHEGYEKLLADSGHI